MITVEKPTSPISDVGILLGRQGENKARQIVFDLAWLIEEYGNGTAVLVHQRSKDSAPYICTTTQDGSSLTWTLNNLDTAYDGWGQAELRWTVSDVLAKTLVYKTMVVRSITADSEIPDAYQSWYDEMIDYIDEHCASPEQIAAAVEEYLEEHPIIAPVQSVNNKTGDVTLTASDVGALPSDTTIPTKVSQLQNDSGFGTYSKPSGGIPKTDLASGVQASLDKADSALQTAPVTSVNNKTGAVTLSASDVGAGTYSKPSGGIPSSDMTSSVQTSLGKADSAYQKPSGGIPSTDMSSAVQTSLGKADSALQTAPVTSVNTKTGAVTLAAGDIGYDDSATYDNGTVGKELTDLKGGLNGMNTATSSDVGKALKAKTVNNGKVTEWEFGEAGGDGLTAGIKAALLQIASKVAYIDDDGQDYYDALEAALYPPSELVSISAVYTQSGTVYDKDSLDSLKSDLVVTALYEDTTTETITTYTLSGTLTTGTSTVTVSYGGKTDTFTVTVIHSDVPSGYTLYDYVAPSGVALGGDIKNYGILTDLQLSTDYTVETKMYVQSGYTNLAKPPIFGTRAGSGGTKEFALFYCDGYNHIGYWFSGTDTSNTTVRPPSKDNVHTYTILPVGKSTTYPSHAVIKIDSTEYDTNSSSTGVTFDPWFGIYSYAISATGLQTNNVTNVGQLIGEIKVTDSDDELIYHLLPVKDPNGKYGYYEKVNGVFYYNANYAVSGYTGGMWGDLS